jgi:hypothetical protein
MASPVMIQRKPVTSAYPGRYVSDRRSLPAAGLSKLAQASYPRQVNPIPAQVRREPSVAGKERNPMQPDAKAAYSAQTQVRPPSVQQKRSYVELHPELEGKYNEELKVLFPYINNCLVRGFSRNDIITTLVETGWDKDEVEEVMQRWFS